MGMQHLSSPEALMELHKRDPEHLALMLGVCLSKPYVDEVQKKKLQYEVKQKKYAQQKSDDYFKELDKKIAKSGNFWEGFVTIEPYIKYRHNKPSWYAVRTNDEPSGKGNFAYYFKSDKIMKRALYLWISKGMPLNGQFSLSDLNYSLRGQGIVSQAFLDNLLSEAVPELPKKEETNG